MTSEKLAMLHYFIPRACKAIAPTVSGAVLFAAAMTWTARQTWGMESSIAGPRIQFYEETYDFGTRDRIEKTAHVFKFKNAGDATLNITRLSKTCGCFAVLMTADTVEPGGEGGIEVTLDTSKYVGKMVKAVYVHSNDPVNPIVKLTAKATIERLIFLDPEQVYVDRKQKGEAITQKVEIMWKRDEPLEVSGLRCSSKDISARIVGSSKTPHPCVAIEVTIGPGVPMGRLDERVELHTTDRRWPLVSIPVVGFIEGEIQVIPEVFSFGHIEHGKSASQKIAIAKAHEPNLRVEEVVSSLDFVAVELKEVLKGRKFEIVVTLKADAPVGAIRGNIDILTNSPEQPKLAVQVFGLIRPKSSPQETVSK
jgi:hypothetical protein